MVQSLVQFIPGVNDLLMLGKAFNHEREVDAAGRPRWDRVIVDAPATGHGVTFFRLPRVIRDAVPTGNLHREASEMWGLLTDRARTAVHLVSIPEELPVQETKELRDRLRDDLGIPLGHLVINKALREALTPEVRGDLRRLTPTDARLERMCEAARIRSGRAQIAARHMTSLRALELPVIELPQRPVRRLDRAALEELADTFAAQRAR